MTPLAASMLGLFIAAWFVALGGWLYGARYFLPMWAAGFRGGERHKGYAKKSFIGLGVFLAANAVAWAAGLIAEFWAGGWS